jgi:hypothetical protein
MLKVSRDPRVSFPKIFLRMAMSIIFRELPIGFPKSDEDTKIGTTLYRDLLDDQTNHRLSLNIRQKFILFAHYRFIISKFFGNYHTSASALTHHPPTMKTFYVLQHVSNTFFNLKEPNYLFFDSVHPPICLNKCCEILSIIDRLLKRDPYFENLKSIDILRVIQKCAFTNIGIKIFRDADFGIDSSYLCSITFWRELTPQMFWAWANQDGLLRKTITKYISHKKYIQGSKLAM